MIIRYHDALQPAEEEILKCMARAFGGVLQVPVITRTSLQNKCVLYFGDHVIFALEDSALKVFSIPTFPCRNRHDLAAQMSDAAVPAGIKPYARRKREMQVAVSDLLRHLARCKPVLARCPWLPEQVEALRTLESVA